MGRPAIKPQSPRLHDLLCPGTLFFTNVNVHHRGNVVILHARLPLFCWSSRPHGASYFSPSETRPTWAPEEAGALGSSAGEEEEAAGETAGEVGVDRLVAAVDLRRHRQVCRSSWARQS